MASLSGAETSVGRFVKAAYYSNFAHKAETPEQAIFTLGHIMNNFDRPKDISKDLEDDLPAGERSMEVSKGPKSISEVTNWTVLHDMTQGHFYFRTINALNFSKFDIKKLVALKAPKKVTLDAVNANTSLDATDLFLNRRGFISWVGTSGSIVRSLSKGLASCVSQPSEFAPCDVLMEESTIATLCKSSCPPSSLSPRCCSKPPPRRPAPLFL